MNPEKAVVLDPDPTDMQLQALNGIGLEGLQLAGPVDPQVVQLLVYYHRVTLAQLKASQGQVATAIEGTGRLRDERENLRIDLATLRAASGASWMEIPVSILAGFAINMLTSGSSTTLGWVFLLLAIVMLFLIRRTDLASAVKPHLVSAGKGQANVR